MVIGLFSYSEKTLRARIYGYLWKIITFVCLKVALPHVSGGCTTTVKKSKFNLVNGFREDLANMEDVDLAVRMKKIGDIVLEKKCRGIASARRFEREGYIKWSIIWFVTGIWYYITGKSFLKTYKCVR